MRQPILTREQIMEIIPHRDPMLLLDEVTEHVPGELVRTRFTASLERDLFRGHFPGDPVLPGVYTLECMAQSADILLLSLERYTGKAPLFLGINNVRFLARIGPGDTLETTARIQSERLEKAIATCVCEVQVNGVVVATGEVTLAMR